MAAVIGSPDSTTSFQTCARSPSGAR